MTASDLEIRRATADDLGRIIDCCSRALGWTDGRANVELFTWKHVENPFGESLIWIAEDADEVVGVRAMMRWQLVSPNGATLNVVRATDTATLPTHQGRGIFRELTMLAVREMTELGVDSIFNTPNSNSGPGYLKMGWTSLGRVPIAIRPSIRAIPRLLRSRVSSDKWGVASDFGVDPRSVEEFPGTCRPAAGWATPESAAYLHWRYGIEHLHYRYVPVTDECGVFARLKARGATAELSVCEVVGNPEQARIADAISGVAHFSHADVVVVAAVHRRHIRGLSTKRLGPELVWRTLSNQIVPPARDLSFSLGTVELF